MSSVIPGVISLCEECNPTIPGSYVDLNLEFLHNPLPPTKDANTIIESSTQISATEFEVILYQRSTVVSDPFFEFGDFTYISGVSEVGLREGCCPLQPPNDLADPYYLKYLDPTPIGYLPLELKSGTPAVNA